MLTLLSDYSINDDNLIDDKIEIKVWEVNPEFFREKEYKKGFYFGFTVYLKFNNKKNLNYIKNIVQKVDFFVYMISNGNVFTKKYKNIPKKQKLDNDDDMFFETLYLFKDENNFNIVYNNMKKILNSSIKSEKKNKLPC